MTEQRPGLWSRLVSWIPFLGDRRQPTPGAAPDGEPSAVARDVPPQGVPTLEEIDLARLPALFPEPKDNPILAELELNASFLRSPPQTAIDILNLTAKEDASIHDLDRLISKDAALSTTILRVANSAAFRTTSTVDSIRRAITLLGFTEIQNVAITTSALSSFDLEDPNMARLATHGMEVGLLARHIAYERDGMDAEMAFACGVLHDLGKQALLAQQGAPYAELLTRQGESPNAMHLVEDDELEVDHGQLGAMVLTGWQFPAHLVAAAGLHHRMEELYGEDDLAGLVWLLAAIKLADQYTYLLAETADASPEMITSLHQSEAATLLGFGQKDIERLWEELQRVLIQTGKIFDFGDDGATADTGDTQAF